MRIIILKILTKGDFDYPGEAIMANKIEWENGMDKALSRAKAEGKHVLLDFFNPG